VPNVHPNPSVRGERVYLRPLERDDLAAALPAINDREIASLTGFPMPVSKETSERWYDEHVAKKHGESNYHFVICLLGSSELIGQCDFHHIWDGFRTDLGIFLLPGYVGKGYGTDALNALVDFGFGELTLERIGLTVDPENERAIRSYEKCGFVREGIIRAGRRHRGEIRDELQMSILRPEWEKLDRKRSWDYPAPKRPAAKRRAPAARKRSTAKG
jgi:RimJ/RimL family protein N-acetyltransferase